MQTNRASRFVFGSTIGVAMLFAATITCIADERTSDLGIADTPPALSTQAGPEKGMVDTTNKRSPRSLPAASVKS